MCECPNSGIAHCAEWGVGGGGYHAHTSVDACDCTLGVVRTSQESALKAGWEKFRCCCTVESNLRQYCTWLLSPQLYQLRH